MPRVSILIPCYNAERWIQQCIESALAQTNNDCEVIVVDDGSSDSSLGVIQSFGDRIQFETGPNQGGNPARNRLLELATGEWVQYLDADDYLLPDKVAQQLRHATNTGCDVVYSPVKIEDGESGAWQETKPDQDQSIEELWIRWQVAQTGAVLWRRQTLEDIGGWNEDYSCCQDNELTLRAILSAARFSFCSSAGAVYRVWSEDTVCRQNPSRVIETRTQLIEKMLGFLRKNDRLQDTHLKAAGTAFMEMGRRLAATNLSQAGDYHRRASKIAPFFLDGAAAPLLYRAAHRIGGFVFAERVAALFRRSRYRNSSS